MYRVVWGSGTPFTIRNSATGRVAGQWQTPALRNLRAVFVKSVSSLWLGDGIQGRATSKLLIVSILTPRVVMESWLAALADLECVLIEGRKASGAVKIANCVLPVTLGSRSLWRSPAIKARSCRCRML